MSTLNAGRNGMNAAPSPPPWVSLDKLTVRLSYFQQKEDHKLAMVNDKPTNLQYDSLDGGATATGEFGGMLKHIFEPESQTSFHWESWKKARARRLAVYGHAVPEAHSQYFVENGAYGGPVHRAIVGYYGNGRGR